MNKKRILSGIRPTGALHLGHYAGALQNWVRLQDEYECFYLIADYQVSDYADDIDTVRRAVFEIATDWLAVGLDPERSHFVIESLVPEHAELTVWLSWYVGLGRLQRNPTLKAEMDELESRSKEAAPVAFFTYPVMQVANILMPKANLVPTGEDQAPHVEMTREVARRFNRLFGEVFPEPDGLVGTGAAPGRRRRAGEDEQVVEQRHLPEGRRGDGDAEGDAHVHRPDAHPRD